MQYAEQEKSGTLTVTREESATGEKKLLLADERSTASWRREEQSLELEAKDKTFKVHSPVLNVGQA